MNEANLSERSCSTLQFDVAWTHSPVFPIAGTLVWCVYTIKTIGTMSTRFPEDLEAELEAYLDEERLDQSIVVRKLLSEGLEA